LTPEEKYNKNGRRGFFESNIIYEDDLPKPIETYNNEVKAFNP
jgi:hypothetical protein